MAAAERPVAALKSCAARLFLRKCHPRLRSFRISMPPHPAIAPTVEIVAELKAAHDSWFPRFMNG